MYVGLVIKSHSVSLLAARNGRVKKWHKLPLPEGLIRDGLILNPQEVGRTIAALFKSAGVARDNVVVSISGLPFTYRIIPMPVLKPAIVDEAMQRAARKEIPISLDELYLTWQALPDGREEIEYFVVGIPRHHLDTLVETLRIAGITPSLVDLPALALARVAGQEKAILVNMDRDYFDIVVVQDGMPRVLRTLTARGSQATLEDNIRLLADELTRTIAFHESHYPRQPLDRTTPVLLTGEFVTGNPLAIHLLQSEFEFPVEQLAVPLTCPEGFPAGDFGINAGLVLKRMRRQKAAVKHFHDVNINLLAGRVQKKPRAKPPATGKIILWLVVIAAILGLYPVYQNRLELGQEISAKQTELRRLSREYNLATLRKEESDRTEATIQQITNDARAVRAANESILRLRGKFGRDLDAVTGLAPPSILITSINIEASHITVYGETEDIFTVIEYARALENHSGFREVRIAGLDEGAPVIPRTPDGTTVIQFAIAITQ